VPPCDVLHDRETSKSHSVPLPLKATSPVMVAIEPERSLFPVAGSSVERVGLDLVPTLRSRQHHRIMPVGPKSELAT